MKRFRVQNYKNIEDTEWITCNNLTCFVGKNESGKSAIFQALAKINPSNKEKYNGLKEFPRKRLTHDFSVDLPVASADFLLSDIEASKIRAICPRLAKVTNLIVTRLYSGDIIIDFEPKKSTPDVSYARFFVLLKDWQLLVQDAIAPEGKGDQLTPIKTTILNGLAALIQKLNDKAQNISKVEISFLNELSTLVSGQLTEDWRKKVFKKLYDGINQFKDAYDFSGQLEKVNVWVQENLPKFIYFSEINMIESAINVPDFISRSNSNPLDPRLRATKCLFEHVGLELEDIQRLDPTKNNAAIADLRRMADERAIKMSAASSSMTELFSGWWEQREHKFRYQVDGPFFRVWVSDNLDPSEIELDQRSQGMQYFFSFYLVFLVEAKGVHENTIILLDEPALHLHGTAQQKVVKFLEKLSDKNQLLYSTHSPFMIDGEKLTNVRVISEKTDGTVRVSEDVWPKDGDALFPLQAGLGYSIVQTLFYSKRQLIVEGLTDYWILKSINSLLAEKNMTCLRKDVAIVPCGGVSKLLPLASLLVSNDIQVVALLDGDNIGKQKGRDAEGRLLTKCLFINDFIDQTEAEMEDLLPETLYLDAVDVAYPGAKTIKFTPDEIKIKCISKRLKAGFDRAGKDFEKWGPSRVIVEWIHGKPDIIPIETLARFEKIFMAVNNSLKYPKADHS